MPSLDDVCPSYVGDQRISLELAAWAGAPRAFAPVVISVDFTKATPGGVVMPLVFTVASPSSTAFIRRFVRRVLPSALSFTPREGGRHLVRLGELAHNHWWGSLLVIVEGDFAPAP